MKKYISYLRVSTKSQEKSGLGLLAQRAIVAHFVNIEGAEIVHEYLESESEVLITIGRKFHFSNYLFSF